MLSVYKYQASVYKYRLYISQIYSIKYFLQHIFKKMTEELSLIRSYFQTKPPTAKVHIQSLLMNKSFPLKTSTQIYQQLQLDENNENQNQMLLSLIRREYNNQYSIFRIDGFLANCEFCNQHIKTHYVYICNEKQIGLCCAPLLYGLLMKYSSMDEARRKIESAEGIVVNIPLNQQVHQMRKQIRIPVAVDMMNYLIYILEEQQKENEQLPMIEQLRDGYCQTGKIEEKSLIILAYNLVKNYDKFPKFKANIFQVAYPRGVKNKVYEMVKQEYDYCKFFMSYEKRMEFLKKNTNPRNSKPQYLVRITDYIIYPKKQPKRVQIQIPPSLQAWFTQQNQYQRGQYQRRQNQMNLRQ